MAAAVVVHVAPAPQFITEQMAARVVVAHRMRQMEMAAQAHQDKATTVERVAKLPPLMAAVVAAAQGL
jgi:hypothetical protein